jgi:hypothetical protein
MKFRTPELILGCFLTVAVFSTGMMFSSPVQQSSSKETRESNDDRIAKYTLWLAILTGGLVAVSAIQGFFLLRSDKTARIAAEAAKRSADVIPAIERPYLFIKEMAANVPIGQYAPPSQHVPRYPTVDASFFNYGRTPANIAEAAIFVRILDHIPTDADTINVLADEDSKSAVEVIIGPDRDWSFPTARCIEPITEFASGKALYCWGYIKYRDIFGNIHPTNFCRQYAGKDGLVPVGGFERNKSR